MAELETAGEGPRARGGEERLGSWKEIAAYLGRDVTTVQRWEKREGMPVHRHVHDKASSVYAFRADLEAWVAQRRAGGLGSQPDQPDATHAAVPDPAVTPDAPVRESVATASSRSRPAVRWILAGVALAAGALGVGAFLQSRDYFWTSPLEDAKITLLAGFEGTEQAALSHDGKFLAFLSDKDGPTDVWVTQLGTGQFYNLTRGKIEGLVNPFVRTLGFSPDGALVTFWRRTPGPADTRSEIGIWAVPTLGGDPRPYLEGAAELAWSPDGSRLVYHTPAPGDPTSVKEPQHPPRQLFAAPQGLHAHFPTWSPRGSFIYFVQGSVDEAMDVWRVRPEGGAPERITRHDSPVSCPVMLDERTLLYLAGDRSGGGPWLYSMDVERRLARRLGTGVDRYTSLSASADGRRVAATVTRTRESLWRIPLTVNGAPASVPVRLSLATGRGSSPRLAAGCTLYVSPGGDGDAIWRMADGTTAQVWSSPGARVLGGPAVSADGRHVAASIEQDGRTTLMVMEADGSHARSVTGSLSLRGAPTWAPDGRSLAVAADDSGVPRLFAVSLDGRTVVRLSSDYAVAPAWAPDGAFVIYSGADVGTSFSLAAVRPDRGRVVFTPVTLSRGSRSLRFLGDSRTLVVLRGDLEHKDLWAVDLQTGAERRLTRLPPDFHVRDFDIRADGREALLARAEDQSDIVLMDRARGR